MTVVILKLYTLGLFGCESIFSGLFWLEEYSLNVVLHITVCSLFFPHSQGTERKPNAPVLLWKHIADREDSFGDRIRVCAHSYIPKLLLKSQRTIQWLSKLHYGLWDLCKVNSPYYEFMFFHPGKRAKWMCKTWELIKRVSMQKETLLLTQRILKRYFVLHGDNHQWWSNSAPQDFCQSCNFWHTGHTLHSCSLLFLSTAPVIPGTEQALQSN